MKNYIYRLLTLLVFTSVMFASCSVEYRDRHRKEQEERAHHDHDHDGDAHYNNH
jgi:hypothetical protein